MESTNKKKTNCLMFFNMLTLPHSPSVKKTMLLVGYKIRSVNNWQK